VSVNNPIARGYAWPPIVLVHPHKNPEAPSFQGNFNAISVYTYEKGVLVDDALDCYRRLLKQSFRAMPMAVRLVDSPEQVKRARETGFQTYVRWYDDNVAEALTGHSPKHKGRHVWLSTSFVSEGPIIEDSLIANWGTTDLAIPGNDRLRMHVHVSSPNGLQEVAILDGDDPKPWRRFLPQGAPRLETTIDFFHSKAHKLIVTATDVQGRRAVGWRNPTQAQENYFPRCSDNFNTMPRGKWWGEPGHLMNVRGFENYLVKRDLAYCGTPRIAGVVETKRPAVEFHPRLACRFGTIVDTIFESHYPTEAGPVFDRTDVPYCAQENERLAGRVTYTLYSGRQDSSLVELVEGDLTCKQDFTGKSGVVFRTLGRRGTRCVAASPADGVPFSGVFTPTTRHFAGALPEAGFAALFPNVFNGSVAVVPLEDGLFYSSHTNPDMEYGNLYLKLSLGKREFKRGERIRYRYLAVISRLDPAPDISFVTDVLYSLGIRGEPAYAVTPTVGTVRDTRFILSLEAIDHGFAGTVTEAKLPLDLPVRISGLNPNWDAGILYKGECTLLIPEWVVDEFGLRYVERRERRVKDELLHFPVLEDGTGFLQIDTEVGAKDVFVGNLLVSDNKDAVLMLVDTRPGKAAFVVHNPTDNDMTCSVRPAPGFDLLGSFDKSATAPAGSSVRVPLERK